MSKRQRELTVSEQEAQTRLKALTRRGFLTSGVAAIAGIAGYEWLTKSKQLGQVPWPQRAALDFNGRLAHGYLKDSHLMPTYPPQRIGKLKANGMLGMDDDDELKTWQLNFDAGGTARAIKLALADVQSLPAVGMITNFCCIEGWNTIAKWRGVRFSDFLRKYMPPGRELPAYVSMSTPDEEYYVGLDMKSALHPQTLLAWELNDEPLNPDHGAPLRLVIPVKYGVKNIKRIGLIKLTGSQPTDYWAENGYDWFAGL